MAKTLKPTVIPSKPSPSPHSNGISKPRHQPTTKSPSSITPFQASVYAHLLCIPPGSLTTYAGLARALNSAPRAVGGALRNNPWAPEVPCHRVIASNGFIGGFKGDWEKAPSGINQTLKLKLLKEEGVDFTPDGKLIVKDGVYFNGPWDTRQTKKAIERRMEGTE